MPLGTSNVIVCESALTSAGPEQLPVALTNGWNVPLHVRTTSPTFAGMVASDDAGSEARTGPAMSVVPASTMINPVTSKRLAVRTVIPGFKKRSSRVLSR